MRMWGTDVSKMCDAHLLGEHRELHMLVGAMKAVLDGRFRTLKGHVENKLLVLDRDYIVQRHRDIVAEMRHRTMVSGIWHDTPISISDIPLLPQPHGQLDIAANEAELRSKGCKCCYEARSSLHE